MWIKSDEGKLINLDRVDTIEVTQINSVMCKFGDKGICLGSYNNSEDANKLLDLLGEVLK